MQGRFWIVAVLLLLAGCSSKSNVESTVTNVGPEDQLLPPADWSSPYGAMRQAERDLAAETTLEQMLALLDGRKAWNPPPAVRAEDVARHPGQKYLKDMTIVLDPGHGGDRVLVNYKRGPTGLREAEANLRVAKLLQKLLEDAGVNVYLTRDRDNDLSLADRAAYASEMGADWFISLHHNAAEAPEVNYTSVWVHGDYASNGPALDLARQVSLAVARHSRTDSGYTSPVMLDSQIYEGGFGVLRGCDVPAILVESSFHTNPAEEDRLREAEHNLREAYAVYEALCEHATFGRPTQTVSADAWEGRLKVTAKLDPGLPNWWGAAERGPLPATVQFFADGQRIPTEYNSGLRTASATLPPEARFVEIHHSNPLGNRNWPQRYEVGGDATVTALGPSRRTSTTPPAATDPAEPWKSISQRKLPVLLHQGGDTAAQQVIDAYKLPAGAALTVARIDPASGTLYALRHEDDGRRGKDSTGDNGFPAGEELRLATAYAAESADAIHRAIAGDAARWEQVQASITLKATADALDEVGVAQLTLRRLGDLDQEMPMNVEPNADGSEGGRANWATTDDLVRLLAAAIFSRPDNDARTLALTSAAGELGDDGYVLQIVGEQTLLCYWHEPATDRQYVAALHLPTASGELESIFQKLRTDLRERNIRL